MADTIANKYNAITAMLENNRNLSLEIYNAGMHYGIKNMRKVEIQEPNPNEGEVANPESGMDQQFLEGPRREKHNLDFRARDVIEGLNLLEKACAGEKDVKSTVSNDSNTWGGKVKIVHGNPVPQDGLDNWIFEHFRFIMHNSSKGLTAKMVCYFFETDDVIISSNIVKNVDEGLALYKNNEVPVRTIHHIRRGLLLDDRIQKYSDFINPKPKLLAEYEYMALALQSGFKEMYLAVLDELRPFNVSNQVKNGVFVSMLLSPYYKTDKNATIE